MVLTTGKYLKDVSVQVSGGQEILRSIYRNVSHEFSYGMDDTDHFQKVANKIQKIDSSQKKTIGVLRDHYTGENIDLEFMNKCLEGYGTHIIEAGEKASDDYLISTERGRSYYLYLDEYSILEKNDSYVLLGKVDEKTQKDWERQGISVLSDEYRLCMDNFDPKRKGKVTSIELESGNYNYVF